MSPEQADIGATTPASDIYSLGVLAYWLLTGGEVPFEGGDPATVSAKQTRSEAPRVSDIALGVSREVADVVARALSRNPAARFPTAGAFAQALTQAAAAAPDPSADDVAEAARRRGGPRVAVSVPFPLAGPHAAEPFKAAAARWTGERWRSVATTKTQRTVTVGVIAVAIVAAVLTQFALTGSSISRTPDVTSASSAENWTMNQGDPRHTGILQGPGPSLSGEVAWTLSRQGRITHEPLVVEGVAFWSPGDRSFLALDAATGKIVWENPDLGFVNVTPAYADGRLYVPTVAGLSVLDAGTGRAAVEPPLERSQRLGAGGQGRGRVPWHWRRGDPGPRRRHRPEVLELRDPWCLQHGPAAQRARPSDHVDARRRRAHSQCPEWPAVAALPPARVERRGGRHRRRPRLYRVGQRYPRHARPPRTAAAVRFTGVLAAGPVLPLRFQQQRADAARIRKIGAPRPQRDHRRRAGSGQRPRLYQHHQRARLRTRRRVADHTVEPRRGKEKSRAAPSLRAAASTSLRTEPS